MTEFQRKTGQLLSLIACHKFGSGRRRTSRSDKKCTM